MSKHDHHPQHDTALPANFPEDAYDLVKTLIGETDWQEWAIAELMHTGPRHKQLYSALLLGRMHHLVQSIEQITKTRFKVQEGQETESGKDEVTVPVPLPFTVIEKEGYEAIAEGVAPAPAHEILAFNTLLQSIEWGIAALNAKPVQR